MVEKTALHLAFLFFLFFMHADYTVQEILCTVHALFMYHSRDSQLLYSKKYIKNESHGTIHIFKNYFATMFSISVFNKISSIQTDLK